MSFIEQAAKVFSGRCEFRFHAVLFGRDAIYIEGARPIEIGENEMIFKTPDVIITLSGERLAVKELADDCASVIGRICSFSVREL